MAISYVVKREVGRGAGGREPDAMATVEGRPAQYGVSLRQLRELMESRGAEGLAKINALGGPQELCKKLYTSPTDVHTQLRWLHDVELLLKHFWILLRARRKKKKVHRRGEISLTRPRSTLGYASNDDDDCS
ncbi:hypothetical protein RR46_07476 [Papilio xuthus]|uniref:Uncharacterized protein n=1 Tax=Papilio xuthus TaxID=66420 RepID=A0A194Q520_PAPXU|nr:hypothetical protein RR46_07476 [Papilio xuthus]